jgi:hypothetical protein
MSTIKQRKYEALSQAAAARMDEAIRKKKMKAALAALLDAKRWFRVSLKYHARP